MDGANFDDATALFCVASECHVDIIEGLWGSYVDKETKFRHVIASYGKTIKYMELPCLNLGKKDGRQNFVPMDFCEICEGQRVVKDNLNSRKEKILEKVIKPFVRRNKIAQIMEDEMDVHTVNTLPILE
ncbi:hypothetical protein SUGI_1428870 [Cryptomeria japonica]|uniref:PAZ domain-containing protein n=1 Tax=Cryptomeria japonica TaxID=3369 RepID=A0AAD3RNZ7_CRYJA|nr:hypothetical protein SUGI_1428870 [Cryptomeria japonica]